MSAKAAADLELTLTRLHQVAAMAAVLKAAFSDETLACDPDASNAVHVYAETIESLLAPTFGAVQTGINVLQANLRAI